MTIRNLLTWRRALLPVAAVVAVLATVTLWPADGDAEAISAAGDGVSHVQSFPPTAEGVVLRSCPGLPSVGTTTGACGEMYRMPDGNPVLMRCWTSTSAPTSQDPSLTSAKWFWVTDQGVDPGQSGWVQSQQIPEGEQVPTPECNEQIIEEFPYKWEDPGPLTFAVVGGCTTAGGVLHGDSSNFTPGGSYEVAVANPDGSEHWIANTVGTVTSNGTAPWELDCAGNTPGVYETFLVDTSTGRDISATFTIGSSPPPTAPPATDAPAESTTTTAPDSSTTTTAPPATTTTTTPGTTTTTTPATTTTTQPAPPKPQAWEMVVGVKGGGAVAVQFRAGWVEGRDPIFCVYWIDGVEHYRSQCGTHPSKHFENIPAGNHTFSVGVYDRDGIWADPPDPQTDNVT